MRRHWLDNVRWSTVLVVLVYHVFYIFNASGVRGGVGSFADVQYQDALMYMIYPWIMPLLFAVAGMSARYALDGQTEREFLRARTRKLLVPSTIGLFVFHWIIGIMNLTYTGMIDQIPKIALYPVCVFAGTGPLWFIQMLWIFSLLLIPLRKLEKDRLWKLCEGMPLWALIALLLPVWGAAQIGNTPMIVVYRWGIYFLSFLLGYFVLSHDAVTARLKKACVPLLIAAVAGAAAFTWFWFDKDYSEPACLQHIGTNAYLWIACLAIFGCAKAWCDRTSRFADYMTRASFGIYVVHYAVVAYACYFLYHSGLAAVWCYLLAIAAVLLGSPALYELLRRIPFVRWCVFGIKKTA
ncbi:MAG: acyltransferase [Oscillospiraceae bacterium]|nr:acyltransferase [Oscillospiraceae bacterium]